MKIRFLGAAGRVTGSCTLLESDGGLTRFLVDCGMSQGESDSDRINTAVWPFVASRLDFVLLTHAHLDHSGLLGRLVREGFSGPVYCTRFTARLTRMNLLDAVRLSSAHSSESDVRRIRFVHVDDQPGFEFGQPLNLTDNLQAAFYPSAHIGGACSISIRWRRKAKNWREIVFSGDLGPNVPGHAPQPLLAPRCLLPATPDYMVVESTYGSRIRGEARRGASERLDDLESAVTEAMRSSSDEKDRQPPCVVIPCFSIHRTQELLVDLHALFQVRMRDRILICRPAFAEPEHIESALVSGIRPTRIEGSQNILGSGTASDRKRFHELFQRIEKTDENGAKRDVYALVDAADGCKAEARMLLARAIRHNFKNLKIRVLVDSPMSCRATLIYGEEINKKAPRNAQRRVYRNPALVSHLGVQSEEEVDAILLQLFAGMAWRDEDVVEQEFLTYSLTFCHPTVSERFLKPATMPDLTIVLSSSGMGDVGPITSHLKRELPNPSSTILLTGYAPPLSVAGCLRAFSQTGATGPEGVLKGQSWELVDSEIRARIVDVGAYYSGHADQAGLLDFVFATDAADTPQPRAVTVFVNHGSEKVSGIFRTAIMERAANPRVGDRPVKAVEIPGCDLQWFDLDRDRWLRPKKEAQSDTYEQLLLRLYLEQRRTNDLLAELVNLNNPKTFRK